MANDFSADASCIALYNVESGAITTDSKGSNTLSSAGSPSAYTTWYKQGSNSVYMSSSSTSLYIADASLPSGFPFKNGESITSIGFCFWCAPYITSAAKMLISKYVSNTGFYLRIYSYNTLELVIWTTSGSESVTISTDLLDAGSLFHIGVWINGTAKTVLVRFWDDVNSTVATITQALVGTPLVSAAPFRISGYGTSLGGACTSSSMDEIVLFSAEKTAGDFDSIRQGTYAPGTGTSVDNGAVNLTLSLLSNIAITPIIATDWKLAKGEGPWDFTKQGPKFGYVNNPRWVDNSLATSTHRPCGYWFSEPYTLTVYGYYQQSVDILSSKSYVGLGMITNISDGVGIYKIVILNYLSSSEVVSHEFNEGVANVNTQTGYTFIRDIGGVATVLYFNLFNFTSIRLYTLNVNGEYSTEVVAANIDGTFSRPIVLSDGSIVVMWTTDEGTFYVRSSNWGSSWSDTYRIGAEDNYNSVICEDGSDNTYIAVGSWFYSEVPVVYRSTNGGSSWDIEGSYTRALNTYVLCAIGNNLFLAGYTGGGSPTYYYSISDDRGSSWEDITAPTISGEAYIEFLSIASIGTRMVAVVGGSTTGDNYIMYSDDYGETWTLVDAVGNLFDVQSISLVEKSVYVTLTTDGNYMTYCYCGLRFGATTDYLAYAISKDSGLTWNLKKIPTKYITYTEVYTPTPAWEN